MLEPHWKYWYTITIDVSTYSCISAPSGGPANVTEVDVNSTHIHLSWDPPSEEDHRGVIRGYNINVTELETQTVFYFMTESTEIIIGPLHPYYVYICMIAAVTIDEGPHTLITVITDEAGKLLKMNNSLHNVHFNTLSTLQLHLVHHKTFKEWQEVPKQCIYHGNLHCLKNLMAICCIMWFPW